MFKAYSSYAFPHIHNHSAKMYSIAYQSNHMSLAPNYTVDHCQQTDLVHMQYTSVMVIKPDYNRN